MPGETRRAVFAQPDWLRAVPTGKTLPRGQSVVFTGCGTSFHAAQTGGTAVQALEAVLRPPRADILVCISHEGTTELTMEAERAFGGDVWLVTGNPDSELAELADEVIVCTPEIERSWCHTASYTCAVAALDALNGEEIDWLPAGVEDALQHEATPFEQDRVLVLGAGRDWPTAQEAALKLREGVWVDATAYETEQFLHGHIAAVDERVRAYVLEGEGRAAERAEVAAAQLEGLGCEVTVLETRHPVVDIVPFHLLVLAVAEARGSTPTRSAGRRDPAGPRRPAPRIRTAEQLRCCSFDEIENLRERAEGMLAAANGLAAGDPQRIVLLTAAGETFAASQDFGRGDEVWAQALAESTNELATAQVRLAQAALGQVRGPGGIARFHEIAAEVEPLLAAAGDDHSLYKLHQNAARAFAVQADGARARESAARALTFAQRAGDEDVYCTYLLANLELEGEASASEVLQRAHELLPRGTGLTAWALQAFAEANAWLEQFDQARAFVRKHVELWHEIGRETETELGAIVELWARDYAAAERAARRVVDGQEAHGDLGHGAGSLAVLARAVLEQGRDEETLQLTDKLAAWVAPDDVWTQAELRLLRGRATGDARLVRDGLDLLEATEYLNPRARAWLDLQLVEGVGADRALELYERKGNVAGARLARELAERVE